MEYSSTVPSSHTNTVTVPASGNTGFVVGGLLPRTNYTFSVRVQGTSYTSARNGTAFTATPEGYSNQVATSCKVAYYFLCLQRLGSFSMAAFSPITV